MQIDACKYHEACLVRPAKSRAGIRKFPRVKTFNSKSSEVEEKMQITSFLDFFRLNLLHSLGCDSET